jgi:hypothetical protein
MYQNVLFFWWERKRQTLGFKNYIWASNYVSSLMQLMRQKESLNCLLLLSVPSLSCPVLDFTWWAGYFSIKTEFITYHIQNVNNREHANNWKSLDISALKPSTNYASKFLCILVISVGETYIYMHSGNNILLVGWINTGTQQLHTNQMTRLTMNVFKFKTTEC